MNPKNVQYSDYIEHQLIKLFIQNMENNYYDKYDNDDEFKSILLKNYNILKEKVLQRAKEQEIMYTVLPYSMVGSTIWKKMAKTLKN